MEYYPRKIDKNLENWVKRKEIILIKGPRQSGKTTVLQHLQQQLGGHYITLEDEELLQSFEKNPKEFIKRYIENKQNLLFIDEAQYNKNVGKNLKLIYDLFSDKIKIFVTGSGSFDIKVEIGKHLVGRVVYFELLPLDFEEFLLWKAKDLHKIFTDYKKTVQDFLLEKEENITMEPVFQQEFNSLLQEYLLFGGYPAIVKEEDTKIKIELLKNLARTYLEKDVFFFFNVMHMEKFKKVLNYLSFNNGSLLEISSIISELHMDFKTIENYLSILSDTSVISLLSPYYKNLTTELKKARKIYFNDLGLRNSILNNFLLLESRIDKGVMLENFILNELKTQFNGKINYWRTAGKAEVDFILHINSGVVPIEVKSQTKPGKSFHSFIKSYKPKRALVFTEKDLGVKQIENTKIGFIPHYFI
ncbi:MAG: ATP-binding protein [Candidatus Thermoplasmatota archaeon]|jgi:predicted AAA+ superfamily ATPase|nr:ATP-binding protein [Candidatus Thermoplasmatota archaeon]